MRFRIYLKRFFDIGSLERKLLIKGIIIVLLLIPIFKLLPLNYYTRLLKLKKEKIIIDFEKIQLINMINKTINRIDTFTFYNLNCFIKSATFKILLNQLGIRSRIAFGVNISNPHSFESHSYIIINNRMAFMAKKGFTIVYSLE